MDRNRDPGFTVPNGLRSSPARGTWIEIMLGIGMLAIGRVVPRKGDVDRNRLPELADLGRLAVVPRKGDVDRNKNFKPEVRDWFKVVPRKGDVDRNRSPQLADLGRLASSPARGTWIEMPSSLLSQPSKIVVPRKGDVDRNCDSGFAITNRFRSSPARGTWIEIVCHTADEDCSESSPARGTWIEMQGVGRRYDRYVRRPPQGGRG